MNGRLPTTSAAWLQEAIDKHRLALSIVVRIELLSWLGSPADMQLLLDFIAATTVLGLNEPVVQATIRLRQQHKVKLT